MPARANHSRPRPPKPANAKQHVRVGADARYGSDSDSGPEEHFRSSTAMRATAGGGGGRYSVATGGRGSRSGSGNGMRPSVAEETPEQRMLRRMEAGPSEDDEAESESDGSSMSDDGRGGAAPSDDGASLSDGEPARQLVGGEDSVSVSNAYSSGRDGSPGASASSDEDMADVPFEQLAAQRAGSGARAARLHGGLPRGRSSRRGNSAAAGAGAAIGGKDPQALHRKEKPHRENKNRPAEASSRRPVSRLRDLLQAPKMVGKDPRFEDLSGAYNPDRFRKQYAFLYEQQLPAEKSSLKAAMKKVKSADKKEEFAAEAQRIETQLREDAARQKKQQFEKTLKAKERAAVKAGKKPFFLKKSAKRRAELVAKYEDLKKAGRLEKYLAKRRRKNAAKDHRYIPRAGGRGGD